MKGPSPVSVSIDWYGKDGKRLTDSGDLSHVFTPPPGAYSFRPVIRRLDDPWSEDQVPFIELACAEGESLVNSIKAQIRSLADLWHRVAGGEF